MKTYAVNIVLPKLRKVFRTAFLAIALLSISFACTSRKNASSSKLEVESIYINQGNNGTPIFVEFIKGTSHNHPLMAVWTEDIDGNLLETLFVAESYGTGIFGHGKVTDGHWEPGPVQRPAALPYWWHKNGFLPDPENRVPDAITGPTPQAGFILESSTNADQRNTFKVLVEVNQSWDWNEFWTNDMYPDNQDYKTSSQPALVYQAIIDPTNNDSVYVLDIAGHSHYAGKDGRLYEDVSSITTAREIYGLIRVSFGSNRLGN